MRRWDAGEGKPISSMSQRKGTAMCNSGMLARGWILFILFFVLHCSGQTNQLTLVDPAEVPPWVFSFHSMQRYLAGIPYPPLPYNPFPDRDLYVCETCITNHAIYFYDDRDVDYQTLTESQMTQSSESESGQGEDEGQPAYSYPNGSLYLEITGLSTNLDTALLLVHGTVAGEVYELKSTVLLTNNVLTAWNTEQAPSHRHRRQYDCD